MHFARTFAGTYLPPESIEFVCTDTAFISLASSLGDVGDLPVRKAAISHQSSSPYWNHHVNSPCFPSPAVRFQPTIAEILNRDGDYL